MSIELDHVWHGRTGESPTRRRGIDRGQDNGSGKDRRFEAIRLVTSEGHNCRRTRLTDRSHSNAWKDRSPSPRVEGHKNSSRGSGFSSTAKNHTRSSALKTPRRFSPSFFDRDHPALYRSLSLEQDQHHVHSPPHDGLAALVAGIDPDVHHRVRLPVFSAIRIYQDCAPVPERIVDEAGNVLFTRGRSSTGRSNSSPTA